MLRTISYKIYEMRRYLVLSLVISIVAIPIGNSLVIQRDRNRDEMYGEAFWIYHFEVYNMTDEELAAALPPEWGYNDGEHTLPSYLGNITYEYPVFALIFFSIATWLFPGVNDLQPLWLNFLLVLVFNLNLVMIAVLLGNRLYTARWARLFFGGYFVYGLILSAGGGKLEPLADCLMLMAMILRSEGQRGKAMFTLGLAVQTKIYPGVLLPLMFLEAPSSVLWFGASMLLTVIPFLSQGLSYDSLLNHFLNTPSYSEQIVNPLYPGFGWATPVLGTTETYFWPAGLIPLTVYIAFMVYTLRPFIPSLHDLSQVSLAEPYTGSSILRPFRLLFKRLLVMKPLYVYMLPAILIVYRWVMPWYLFWLGLMILVLDRDEDCIAYLKLITVVGFLYAFGLICNWPYFITGPAQDFYRHFILGWYTLVGVGVMVAIASVLFVVWKFEIERRERMADMIREAEARGELII
ncbi:MAG: hypothetical protein HXY34_09755 [Candidatus Thorarchaeota archaeon]|nr:hypothetical protein [Candidatus Thorarchaeota archaeon]